MSHSLKSKSIWKHFFFHKECFLLVGLVMRLWCVFFLFFSDEDMQSLASLMSVKPTDIGNLDDFNESDEEEDKKSVTATGRQDYTNTVFWPLDISFSSAFLFCSYFRMFFHSALFLLLQLSHTLLPVQIALLPLHLTSDTPRHPLCHPQVALSPPLLLSLTVCISACLSLAS